MLYPWYSESLDCRQRHRAGEGHAAADDAAANAGNDATANDTATNNAAASDAAARGAATATLMIQQQIHTWTQVVLDYVPMIR